MGEGITNADSVVADIVAAVENRPRNWRAGQAAFNRLYEVAPGWADWIRGGPLDPFHRDDRLAAFYEWLPSVVAEDDA